MERIDVVTILIFFLSMNMEYLYIYLVIFLFISSELFISSFSCLVIFLRMLIPKHWNKEKTENKDEREKERRATKGKVGKEREREGVSE